MNIQDFLRELKPKVLAKIVGIVLSGVLSFAILSKSPAISVALFSAIFVWLLWDIISIKKHCENLESHCENLESLIDSLSRHTRNLNLSLVTLAQAIQKEAGQMEMIAKAIELKESNPNRQDSWNTWTALTRVLREQYCATNFIADLYETRGREIVKFQVAKHNLRFTEFSKLLFYNQSDRNDCDKFEKILAMHRPKGKGMNIWSMDYARFLHKSKADKEWEKKIAEVGGLERTDFAVFDGVVVMIWFLDADRQIQDWDLLIGEEAAKPFLTLFNALIARAIRH